VAVKSLIFSPRETVAKSTVISGSANINELVTAALTWFITWNQMKHPSGEPVKVSRGLLTIR